MKYRPRYVRGFLRRLSWRAFVMGERPMTGSTPPPDAEVAAEQAYLDGALQALSAMRERAQRLLDDLIAAGNPDLDYVAALSHRVSLLADSPRPLLFGRIDEDGGHLLAHRPPARRGHAARSGRRRLAGTRRRALLPGQRAKDSMGLTRRRQFMVDRRPVSRSPTTSSAGRATTARHDPAPRGDALLAELERARTGEMLDIVATIQAEQDEIIRAPLEELLAVQGGPGTGKTAVGLHRAAFLLYNHPSLSAAMACSSSGRAGRSCATSRRCCPSLGEEAVVQTTIADIAPKAKVRVEEPMEVRRLKGDTRMAEVLRRALHGRRQPLQDDVTLRVRFARGRLQRDSGQRPCRLHRRAGPPRTRPVGCALRARLVSEARPLSAPRPGSGRTSLGSRGS